MVTYKSNSANAFFKLTETKVFAMPYAYPIRPHTRPNIESKHYNQCVHKTRRWGVK